jgi:hypothetical protein
LLLTVTGEAKTRSLNELQRLSLLAFPASCTTVILTGWDNDDDDENDDTDDQTHAHLHVLPPHLLSHTIGASPEALRRHCQVIGLVLKGIESLASLGDFVNVLSHHTDSVVNLLSRVSWRSIIHSRRDAAKTLDVC